MSEKAKTQIDLSQDYSELVKCLEGFVDMNKASDEEAVYTASIFLSWLKRKVELVSNENNFAIPPEIDLRRSKVFWVDFGFNVGQEFGGKHPAIILRVSDQQVFVLPLSSQAPDDDKKKLPMYVKVPMVYDIPPMTRWANVLNITCVSVQRIDFSSKTGRVPGLILDKISAAISICGIR